MGRTKQGEPIHIVGLDIANFRRLRFARVRVDGEAGLVRVTGKNGAGKTSLLQAIMAALGGARAFEEAGTIFEGAGADEEKYVRTLLSNGFVVERRFTEATPKGALSVTTADGARANQTKLNEWLGERTFDPLAFFDISDEKRTATFLSLSKDPDLPQKLKENRERRKELYDERTPANVTVRRLKGKPAPEGAPPEPVDVSDSMRQLETLEAEQRHREGLVAEVEKAKGAVTSAQQYVDSIRAQLAAAEQNLAEQEAWLNEAQAELVGAPDDRTAAIAAVRAHVADAAEVEKQRAPWVEWSREQDQLADAIEEANRLTGEIEACDVEMGEMLAAADIPVPGLSFDPEGNPLINGRPWSIASGAERIKVAVAVALASRPQLRVMLLDEEANALDPDSLVALDALAKEHGFQVWACRIGLEGQGEVVVEDGEAVSA